MQIEFFIAPDGRGVTVKDGAEYRSLSDDSVLIDTMSALINKHFPKASNALDSIYSEKHSKVMRFVKCNFGCCDNVLDIDGETVNLEYVPCPMRGECDMENIICNPAQKITGLTTQETNVAKLIAENLTNDKIAETLFISEQTAKTHRRNIMTKLNCHNTPDLIQIIKRHNI